MFSATLAVQALQLFRLLCRQFCLILNITVSCHKVMSFAVFSDEICRPRVASSDISASTAFINKFAYFGHISKMFKFFFFLLFKTKTLIFLSRKRYTINFIWTLPCRNCNVQTCEQFEKYVCNLLLLISSNFEVKRTVFF